MKIILFIIVSLIASSAFCSTECTGPTNASKFIVYLHGMDTVLPSSQELENRQVLQKLSKNLNIRFALPRANSKCPTSSQQVCWTWAAKNIEDLVAVKNSIASAAAECFSKKDYTVLGFSNGGVAVTALLRLCEKVDFKSAIAVGAAGAWFSSDPKNLEACGLRITMMLGSEDKANQKPVRDFAAHLLLLKAPVSIVEYKGTHKLVYEPLTDLLKQ